MEESIHGEGFINTLIDNLPVPLHIPSYNYCGPGTPLKQHLEQGVRPKNLLDQACKEHDIFYSQNKEVSERHVADKVLISKAIERLASSDASLGEKISSSIVKNVMKAKVALGAGGSRKNMYKTKKKVNKKRKSVKRGSKKNPKTKKKVIKGTGTLHKGMSVARAAIKKIADKKNLKLLSKTALQAAKKYFRIKGKPKILKPRTLPLPSAIKGGFLPLIPIIAAIGAMGECKLNKKMILKTLCKSVQELMRCFFVTSQVASLAASAVW